jgi:UDP-N-acetylmuramoyl-tripeptide--D-alanyl-D-alanine ligase
MMDMRTMWEPEDLARWSGGHWLHGHPVSVTGIGMDSRTIQPGEVFIALRGATDGHDYLGAAVARGASSVIVEDITRAAGLPVPVLVVPDTRRALMDLAAGYRGTLTCRMVAVTGSVGKTTVKELIADMLHHVGETARTRGNWNNDIGMPLSLLAARPETAYGVFEVGMNHPGELDPLCAVLQPDIAVVTCIGPVHIEHFSDGLEGIAREKGAVYRGLNRSGVAILNADDAYADRLRAEADGNRMVTVSGRHDADYRYTRTHPEQGLFEVRDARAGVTVTCTAALPGDYFVLDAVLAAATARELGVAWPVIQHAIQHYRPLSMRWNRHLERGVHIVNDAYNANPVSMRAAIQAFLEEPVSGARWLVLGGMRELGADEERIHRELGLFIAARPGVRLVTVGARGAWIAAGARASGGSAESLVEAADAEAAAGVLHARVKAGDAVLFKGSRGEAVEQVWQAWKRMAVPGGETASA